MCSLVLHFTLHVFTFFIITLRAGSVSDVVVAVHATDGVLGGGAAGNDLVDEVAVALEAGLLKDGGVGRLDHDRLVEILEGEALGVVPAVAGLGHVLGDELVRQVAIDAAGDGVVAGAVPGVVLVAHDVAVHAGGGVGAEVG